MRGPWGGSKRGREKHWIFVYRQKHVWFFWDPEQKCKLKDSENVLLFFLLSNLWWKTDWVRNTRTEELNEQQAKILLLFLVYFMQGFLSLFIRGISPSKHEGKSVAVYKAVFPLVDVTLKFTVKFSVMCELLRWKALLNSSTLLLFREFIISLSFGIV